MSSSIIPLPCAPDLVVTFCASGLLFLLMNGTTFILMAKHFAYTNTSKFEVSVGHLVGFVFLIACGYVFFCWGFKIQLINTFVSWIYVGFLIRGVLNLWPMLEPHIIYYWSILLEWLGYPVYAPIPNAAVLPPPGPPIPWYWKIADIAFSLIQQTAFNNLIFFAVMFTRHPCNRIIVAYSSFAGTSLMLFTAYWIYDFQIVQGFVVVYSVFLIGASSLSLIFGISAFSILIHCLRFIF